MPSASKPRRTLAWLLLPLAVAGLAAVWTLASLYSGRQCSWMAVVGAVDLLWMLGLAGVHRPVARAVTATTATVVLIFLANWSVIAANIAGMVGLGLLESMGRLGSRHAWVMADIANRWQDGVWLTLALAIAAGWPFLSARLRATSAR